jgi:hypothetical protein
LATFFTTSFAVLAFYTVDAAQLPSSGIRMDKISAENCASENMQRKVTKKL